MYLYSTWVTPLDFRHIIPLASQGTLQIEWYLQSFALTGVTTRQFIPCSNVSSSKAPNKRWPYNDGLMGMQETGVEAWHNHLALMPSHWCSFQHLSELDCSANISFFHFVIFFKHVRLKIEDIPVHLKHNMPQQQHGKFKSPCDLLTLGCLPSVWVRTSYSKNQLSI